MGEGWDVPMGGVVGVWVEPVAQGAGQGGDRTGEGAVGEQGGAEQGQREVVEGGHGRARYSK